MTTISKLSCREVLLQISVYLDHEVDVGTREAIEAHLRQCRHCFAVMEGMRNVILLLGDWGAYALPADFRRHARRALAGRLRRVS